MINISEFYDFLEDNRYSIEEKTNYLEMNHDDLNNINLIKQLFHEVALKARDHEIIQVEALSLSLEGICTAIAAKRFRVSDALSDVILLTVDHLFDYTKNLIEQSSNFDAQLTTNLKYALKALLQSKDENFEDEIQNVLNVLTSQLLVGNEGTINNEQIEHSIANISTDNDDVQKLVDQTLKAESDLAYFKTLLIELEHRFPIHEKRGERILPIALAMNQLADNPADPIQLEAAIYLHDIAMAFIPDSILFKTEMLSAKERIVLERHPMISADLLKHIGDWDEAATIILQHHEKADGSGYPKRLDTSEICTGAKIISILDAFDAMTHARSDRSFKKTILRALSEIVKNTHQFDESLTKIFIKIIRSHYGRGQ